jgi:hypothetical protein
MLEASRNAQRIDEFPMAELEPYIPGRSAYINGQRIDEFPMAELELGKLQATVSAVP